jgi:hypothetical protein
VTARGGSDDVAGLKAASGGGVNVQADESFTCVDADAGLERGAVRPPHAVQSLDAA